MEMVEDHDPKPDEPMIFEVQCSEKSVDSYWESSKRREQSQQERVASLAEGNMETLGRRKKRFFGFFDEGTHQSNRQGRDPSTCQDSRREVT